MASNRMTRIGFLWVNILVTCTANSDKTIKNIANFDCYTDYEKQLVCFWEVVNSSSSCKEDFRLKYTDYKGITKICQTLQNDHYQGFRLPDKCVCNISLARFIASEDFIMEVDSHGQSVNNTTISVCTKIKPKPPSNVHVNVSDSEMGLVSWDINYRYQFIRNSLSFHVQILSKEDRKMALEDIHIQAEFRYRFMKRQLTREDHVVRVRAKPTDGKKLIGFWSEWSPEIMWKNEYSLTIVELKNIIIPISCLLTLCLILSSYFLFVRYKKKWWDNVPDPAKSKIYQDRLRLKQQSKPNYKNANIFCSRCLSSLINSKKKTKAEHQGTINKDYQSQHTDLKKLVFEPKDDDVESSVELCICSKADSQNHPVEEEKQDNADDHLLEDLSISRMFSDILGNSLELHMETLDNLNIENTFGIFCWSNKLNSYTQDQMQEHKLHPELGYHHHIDTSKDVQAKLDNNKTLFDSLLSLEKENPLEYGGVPFPSSNHSNVDSTLEEPNADSEHCSISMFCLDSFAETTSNKSTDHHLMGNSQSIVYYNNKHSLFLQDMEDKCSTNSQPKISQSTVQHYDHSVSSSYYDLEAQQSSTDYVRHEPTHVDRQENFDQAVPPYNFTAVCQDFGYQCNEEADQHHEMTMSSDCIRVHSEYQPFQSLASPHENVCLPEPDCRYQVGDGQCQNNSELSEKNKNLKVTDSKYGRKNFNNDAEHVVFPRFYLRGHRLNNLENTTMGNCCPSDVYNILDMQSFGMTLNPGGVAFALTFDICNHLRNLKNMHGQNLQVNSLKIGIQPISEKPFLCSLD